MKSEDLRELLDKTSVIEYLNSYASLNNSSFIITDCSDNKLFGEIQITNKARSPILFKENIIGYVCGVEINGAGNLAQMLSYMANCEEDNELLTIENNEIHGEMRVLYNLTEKLTASKSVSECIKISFNELIKITKGEFTGILLRDSTGEALILEEASGPIVVGEKVINNYDKLFKEMNGKSEIISNTSINEDYACFQPEVKSLMYSPIKIRNKVIGLIFVGSESEEGFTSKDVKILSAVAFQTASAIENTKLYEDLKKTFTDVVYVLSETIEKRDYYTGGHTKRVMELSASIGRFMNLPKEEIERLSLAAILHDIGKIGIRDSVLNKTSELDDTEFEIMKMHPIFGDEILNRVDQLHNITPGIRSHHERFDGTGYPDGLKGEEIDIIARIIAVADTFDAMTTDRPYRKGIDKEVAIKELNKYSGIQHDSEVVEAFTKLFYKTNIK